MTSDKIDADYTSFVRKVEMEILAAKNKVKIDLLTLKTKAENPA